MSAVDDTVSAKGGAAVTGSDTADLPRKPTRGIYVGAAGDVKVTLDNGDTVTLVGLTAGVVHPFYVNRVWSTGTTATGIVALY